MGQILAAISIALALAISPALAQVSGLPPGASTEVSTPDVARGYPYRTGDAGSSLDTSYVPLRDFLSSRIDSLRAELFDRMDERDRRYEQKFSAQAEAVKIALDSINQRLQGVNEFRSTLSDQAKTFATRDTYDGLAARIDDVLTRFAGLGTRLTTIESSGTPVAIQNSKDVAALSIRLTESESRTVGQAQLFSLIGTGAGLLFGSIGAWALLRQKREA